MIAASPMRLSSLLKVSIFIVLLAVATRGHAVGFERTTVAAPQPIHIGIWHPSATAVPGAGNTPFRQALAVDAEPKGSGLPLVILSHGDGGWMGGHADTALALAEAGYVAAAITHPGNNSEDERAPPSEWMVSRPRDVVATIDFMLGRWKHAARLAPKRIGVFGFSAGGYTALVAAGGKPDIERAIEHCTAIPGEFVCAEGIVDEIASSSLAGGAMTFASDPRIGAISIAAPGLGFAFTAKGLSALTIPVQIWSGAIDERVPHASNGGPLAAALSGTVDAQLVEQAGHFAFHAPCNPALEKANRRIWKTICVDAPGFDRTAFHREMNENIIKFFDRALPEQDSGRLASP